MVTFLVIVFVFVFLFFVIRNGIKKIPSTDYTKPLGSNDKPVEPPQQEKSPVTYSQYTDSIHSHKFHFTVSGTYYRTREEKRIARNLNNGDILFLEEEPDNPYHSDAIQVISNEEYAHIGYVPREYCLDVKEIMRQNPDYDVEVTNVIIGTNSPFIDAIIKY